MSFEGISGADAITRGDAAAMDLRKRVGNFDAAELGVVPSCEETQKLRQL